MDTPAIPIYTHTTPLGRRIWLCIECLAEAEAIAAEDSDDTARAIDLAERGRRADPHSHL